MVVAGGTSAAQGPAFSRPGLCDAGAARHHESKWTGSLVVECRHALTLAAGPGGHPAGDAAGAQPAQLRLRVGNHDPVSVRVHRFRAGLRVVTVPAWFSGACV